MKSRGYDSDESNTNEMVIAQAGPGSTIREQTSDFNISYDNRMSTPAITSYMNRNHDSRYVNSNNNNNNNINSNGMRNGY